MDAERCLSKSTILDLPTIISDGPTKNGSLALEKHLRLTVDTDKESIKLIKAMLRNIENQLNVSNISELQPAEVNWYEGTITRKRTKSKTESPQNGFGATVTAC